MASKIIIFSTAYYPFVGGAEVAVKEITDRLLNHEFIMLTARMNSDLAKKEQIGNILVYRLGFGIPTLDKLILPFTSVWKAYQINKKKPVIIWSIMASYNAFGALFYTWINKNVKLILTLQEGDPPEQILHRVRFVKPLFHKIFQRANALQPISNFLQQWGRNMGFKGSISKVIPNGVDLARFTQEFNSEEIVQMRQKYGFTDNDFVLVTASRLVVKNGVKDVILALTKLPEKFKFLIAGNGELEGELKELVQKNNLQSRVVFLGYQDHKNLPKILKTANTFIRPSLSEGLGNAFLEAMALNLPVIATPVGGIPDFLKDEETGLFCKVNDPESIAQIVLKLESNLGLQEKLAKTAKKMVLQKYSWENISQQMESLFENFS